MIEDCTVKMLVGWVKAKDLVKMLIKFTTAIMNLIDIFNKASINFMIAALKLIKIFNKASI